MAVLDELIRLESEELDRIIGCRSTQAHEELVDGKWDNRPSWDNWGKRGKPFDNRPAWDNWNKKGRR